MHAPAERVKPVLQVVQAVALVQTEQLVPQTVQTPCVLMNLPAGQVQTPVEEGTSVVSLQLVQLVAEVTQVAQVLEQAATVLAEVK